MKMKKIFASLIALSMTILIVDIIVVGEYAN